MPDRKPVAGWAEVIVWADRTRTDPLVIEASNVGDGVRAQWPVVICPREVWDQIRKALSDLKEEMGSDGEDECEQVCGAALELMDLDGGG